MNLECPIKVEIKAQSSSGFTRETVERRLSELADRESACNPSIVTAESYGIAQEIAYLRALRKRKWGA